MKAFLSALVAMVVIAVGAWVALDALDRSTAQVYKVEDVRLN